MRSQGERFLITQPREAVNLSLDTEGVRLPDYHVWQKCPSGAEGIE
jgi:hypothetical protein